MKHAEAIIVFLIVLMAASAVTQCSRMTVRTITRGTPIWRMEQ